MLSVVPSAGCGVRCIPQKRLAINRHVRAGAAQLLTAGWPPGGSDACLSIGQCFLHRVCVCGCWVCVGVRWVCWVECRKVSYHAVPGGWTGVATGVQVLWRACFDSSRKGRVRAA